MTLVLLAGCGPAATPAGPTTTDISLGSVTPLPGDAEAALRYVNGSKDDPQGEPFVIGVINDPKSAPEVRTALLAAEQTVNTELGGIAGRPLRLHLCEPVDAAEQAHCETELASEGSVAAVILGRLPAPSTWVGPAAAVTLDPQTAEEVTNPHLLSFALTRAGALRMAARLAATSGHEEVLILSDPGQGQRALAEENTGAYLDGAAIPHRYADTTELPAAVAELGERAAVITATGPGGCVELARRISGRDVTVYTSGQCSHSSVHETLGDWSVGWVHMAGGPALATYDADPQVRTYRDRLERYEPGADWTGLANLAFGAVMIATRVGNTLQAGDRSDARGEFAERLRAFAGPVFMGAQEVECGWDTRQPALCQHTARAYRYGGSRNWEPVVEQPRSIR